jgi:hypothetical protein
MEALWISPTTPAVAARRPSRQSQANATPVSIEGPSLRGKRRKKPGYGAAYRFAQPGQSECALVHGFHDDALADGRRLRLLSVVDDVMRESVAEI